MAGKKRGSTRLGKRWSYFFLNGELHYTLEVRRYDNLIVALNCKTNERVAYDLVDTYRRRQRAFTVGQVAKLVGKHKDTIKRQYTEGNIRKGQRAESQKNPDSGRIRYYWSEDDVREIHEFFKTVHIGRPRKDGKVNPGDLISTAELEARLRNETILYTQTSDGQFVPVWRQPDW